MKPFIPKEYKKEPITVRLEKEKLNKIEQKSSAFNISRSRFINECIDYALEHMPDQQTDK